MEKKSQGREKIDFERVEREKLVTAQAEEPWTVVLMSAGDDRVSIVVQLVSDDGARAEAFQRSDPVINAIRWP